MCLPRYGRILDISGDDPAIRTARVAVGDGTQVVGLACVPDAGVGETVMIHAGFAVAVVDPGEAAGRTELLRRVTEG